MMIAACGCSLEGRDDVGIGGRTITSSDDCRDGHCDTSILEPMRLVEQTITTACTQPSDCPTGFCVDGVCCNNACTGACRACSAIKKRGGADGTCGYISNGFDPDNEC